MGQLLFVPDIGSGGGGGTPSDIYISQANGNDNNDGLTPATAVASLAQANTILENAIGLFPLSTDVTYHLDSGFHPYVDPPNITFSKTGLLLYWGDGAGQPGDDGSVVITTGVTSAPSTFGAEVLVAGPLAVNALSGYTIEFLDGGFEGFRRTIARNTATEILMVNGFGATLLPAGVSFRVVRPGAYLLNESATESRSLPQDSILGLVNIGFYSTVTGGIPPTWQAVRAFIYMAGVDGSRQGSGGGQLLALQGSKIIAGTDSSNVFIDVPPRIGALVGLSVTAGGQMFGWGVTSYLAEAPTFGQFLSTSATPSGGSDFSGFYCAGSFSPGQPGFFFISGGRFLTSFMASATVSCFIGQGAYLSLAKALSFSIFSGTLSISNFGRVDMNERAGTQIAAVRQANLVFSGTGVYNITSSAGNIFDLEDSSLHGEGTFGITATGSATCIAARDNAYVHLLAGSYNASGSSGYALDLDTGAKATLEGTAVLAGGRVRARSNSSVDCVGTGAHTLTGTTNVLELNRSKYLQRSGSLSSIASGGAAVLCTGGQAELPGGGSATISGTTFGVSCQAGGSVDFNGDLSGVSGTTSALRVDASNVAAATLAAAGDFVAGVPVGGSPGAGGGSRIGRIS